MAPQILELHELPTDIRAHFLAMPAFQNAMRVTKSASMEAGSAVTVTKTLKTSRLQNVKKAANLPGFAQILAGSNARNIGTPAPAIPKAPAPTTTPTSSAAIAVPPMDPNPPMTTTMNAKMPQIV